MIVDFLSLHLKKFFFSFFSFSSSNVYSCKRALRFNWSLILHREVPNILLKRVTFLQSLQRTNLPLGVYLRRQFKTENLAGNRCHPAGLWFRVHFSLHNFVFLFFLSDYLISTKSVFFQFHSKGTNFQSTA